MSALCVCVFLILLVGCRLADWLGYPGARAAVPAPTRGYILISIDTLRADHLGCYGYSRNTSPYIDSLARRGTVFENAIVQIPGTLPSHMSMLTGLYPAEHGVYPPDAVLSPKVATLAEVFRRQGFRTAGFTEGGYVSGRYGFARGFDEFDDSSSHGSGAVEVTLGRGTRFLESLTERDRFFLFLHSYVVHDPYDPAPAYRSLFWRGTAPDTFAPTGPNLVQVNRGTRPITQEAVDYFEALYDAEIRYLDDVLKDFFKRLKSLRLADQVTVVLTSDHGEEFFEHGRMVHEQVYHHNLHVPLLILHPDPATGRRVAALVQSIDLAPTLYQLAGIRPGSPLPGRSLAPLMFRDQERGPEEAYAEGFVDRVRTVYRRTPAGLFKLIVNSPQMDREGVWVSRSIVFDSVAGALEFESKSYHQPRTLRIEVEGKAVKTIALEPDWSRIALDLGPAGVKRTVRFSSPDCDSPRSLGRSKDPRCLSFMIRNAVLDRWELYRVDRDLLETRDLSRQQAGIADQLSARLESYAFAASEAVQSKPLSKELEQRLKSLGYLH